MKVVFVIPLLNERDTLEPLTEGIAQNIAPHEHRIIFVDDGSTDGSYEILEKIRERNSAVDLIKLRRNFGKSQALAAGIAHAEGDVLVTMDADLQDDPRQIPRFLEKLDEGYDVVCGWKQDRRDPWHKTIPSFFYNHVVSRLFELPLHDLNTGYKAMRMEVAKRLPLYGEMHRMIAVFASRMGYRVTEVPVEHHPRRFGRSKYGLRRFTNGALDVLTAWFLLQHGESPNHVFGRTGCAATLFGFAALLIGLFTGVILPVYLWDSGPPVQLLATALVLLWIVFSFLILIWGSVAFMAGLLGELLLRKLPPIDPHDYIEREARH